MRYRVWFCLCAVLVCLAGCGKADKEKNKESDPKDSYPSFDALDYVTLGDYDSIQVSMTQKDTISNDYLEEAVDRSVQDYISMYDWEIKDAGTVSETDWVSMSFTCVNQEDGQKIPNACSEGMVLKISENPFGYGFYSDLIGKSVGEEVVCQKSYESGEDVQVDLEHKTVEWTVKILGIKSVPEPSDEVMEKVSSGEFKTVDAYREAEREDIRKLYADTYEHQLEQQISEEVKKTCKADSLPDGFGDFYRDHMMAIYTHDAKVNGMEVSEYMEQLGVDKESVTGLSDDEILDSVSDFLIYLGIAKKEKFTMSDGELSEAFEAMAKEYQFSDVDEMLSTYSKGYLTDVALCNALMQDMASHVQVNTK